MANSIILRRRKLGRGSTNGIAAVSTTGIKAVRNWVPRDWADVNHEDVTVFRWGCTSSLPAGMLAKVVNTAASIHWCSDKKQGRLDMQAAGVPVPESWAVEKFRELSEDDTPDMEDYDEKFVMRPARHAQGRDLLVGTAEELCGSYDEDSTWHNGYVSRLINKVAEYRVMVVCNRVAWVAKKTPGNPDDVAWNVAAGGRFDNVRWGEWSLPVIVSAIQAAKVSGTDFCGVDVMVDAAGRPYVLEVNSAPSQTSPYRQQCLAKAFDYIVENGKEHFPTPEAVGGWRDVIHPAVWSREE